MEEETLELINEKIRELLNANNNMEMKTAIELIKAINNPLKCE